MSVWRVDCILPPTKRSVHNLDRVLPSIFGILSLDNLAEGPLSQLLLDRV